MNTFNLRILLLPLFALILSFTANAQQRNVLSMANLAEVNVDEIADIDIKNYYKKAMQNGLTEENLYRLLEEKGLPPNQLAKLVERVGRLGLSPSIRNADPLSETKSEEDKKKEEEARLKEKEKDKTRIVLKMLKMKGNRRPGVTMYRWRT